MVKKMIFCVLLLLQQTCLLGQTPPTYHSADILGRLEKLKVLGSVLYIAAHPDDENTRLLAWLARDQQFRTGYLSITRGDGGQNLIGGEQGIALGMIRTQELLAARRVDAAEQFFTRAYDFGFSKSTDEALRIWDKEKILGDVVWIIRQFQPDIIITRFPPDSRAGHGHHSGSAVLAREAFDAAADSSRFPEHFTKGVQPWQAKRIIWNTFNFGSNNTIRSDQFSLDVGSFNPLLGKSYGEIAAESRSQHKSQGFGVPSSRGIQNEYFSHTAGEPLKTQLMDGVVTNWRRLPGGQAIESRINEIISSFDVKDPSRSVKPLTELYQNLRNLPNGYWKERKIQEVERLIEACSGLYLEAACNVPHAVPGDSLRVTMTMINRSSAKISLTRMVMPGKDSSINIPLTRNRNVLMDLSWVVDARHPVSQPYWLINPMNKGSFTVNDQNLIGLPENRAAMKVSLELQVEGVSLIYNRAVMYKHTDPVKGELFQPLANVPRLSVHAEPNVVVFRKDDQSARQVDVTLSANGEAMISSVDLLAADGKKIRTIPVDLSLTKGSVRKLSLSLMGNELSKIKSGDLNILVNGKDAQSWGRDMFMIEYDHIPVQRYFKDASLRILDLDLQTAGKKAGYIPGAGDKIPEALRQMGYVVTNLDERSVQGDLESFDVIVTGVRAYNIHEWLVSAQPALLEYVRKGGTLLVQYNTNSFIGPLKGIQLGPYPFTISSGRVTDEESVVQFPDASHPLLNWPNKISEKDFGGWIQERGIYFAETWAPPYKPVLGMKDPGEQQDRMGSLIMAEYGKGRFIYTGLVFFRQLPAGVPGAYRLFANLIANPNAK